MAIENKDHYGLPTDPEKNVAGVSLLPLMDCLLHPIGIHMTIEKRIKPGSGIGSSAATDPVKFPDRVERVIGEKIVIPENVKALENKSRSSIRISAMYNEVRSFLLKSF